MSFRTLSRTALALLVASMCATATGCKVFAPKMMKLRDNRVNRDGCQPEKERLPLLKRIADDDNKKSDNPAIKRAAEIKGEEDLCQQKIKAIRYLGRIGCATCYDKDGSVTKALKAGLEDCTPAVRMATIEVISGNFCGQDVGTCCCKPELVKKLSDMAWGVDDNGCYMEPLEEIRTAAAEVAMKCCPNGPYPAEWFPEEIKKEEESKKQEEKRETAGDKEVPDAPAPQPAAPGDKSTSIGPKGNGTNPFVSNLMVPDEGTQLATIAVVRASVDNGYDLTREARDTNGDTTYATLRCLAFGYLSDGAWLEESDRVRDAAKSLLEKVDPQGASGQRPFLVSFSGATATQAIADASAVAKLDPVSAEAPEYNAALVSQSPAVNVESTPRPIPQDVDTVEVPAAPVAVVQEPVVQPQVVAQPAPAPEVVAQPVAPQPVAVQPAPAAPVVVEAAPAAAPQVVVVPQVAAAPAVAAQPAVQPDAVAATQPAPVPLVNVVKTQPVAITASNVALAAQFNGQQGFVEMIDASAGTAMIRLDKSITLPRGSHMVVYHKYVLGRLTSLGEVQVTEAAPGWATVTPVGNMTLSRVSVSDRVTVMGN